MKNNSIWRYTMESVIHRIRRLYADMGPGERKIAEYVSNNIQQVIDSTIGELSNACGCGDATVVRFVRRLGYEGYQAFKIAIAAELGTISSIGSEIKSGDSCFEIFRKRISDILVALQNTEAVLDIEDLELAAQTILNAKRVVVFGLGNSAAIANDAAHKFLRVGLNAQACCDNHMQAIVASHLSEGCVAIGISHSGASKDIVEALRLAKSGGAVTICVTQYGASPLSAAADISLFTKSDETKHSILAMSSRIAQLAIFDAIYTYIVMNADQAAVQAVYNTEMALKQKKYE